jgi:hypothetical protein
MAEKQRRLVDRLVDPSYVADLTGKAVEELKEMRSEAREGEGEISFERRLAQARIDILTAELERRSGGEGESDIVSRLPEILGADASGEGEGSLPERAPDLSVPRNADVPRRRIEESAGAPPLSRLPKLSPDEIKGIVTQLAEHESSLSAKRKQIHDVIDAIQAEIVRRYVSGEAAIS